ncbi:MAG: hypothetical protein OXF22_05305 [Anaerolineaceae bacterium]|nr:hypothetical protein [Anaerolineaceae bacterium]
MQEIDQIKTELSDMKDFFTRVIQIIPDFNITDPKILPYGLKPHTRSVSWIIEQVIVQQAKYNRQSLGVVDVDFSMPDTSLHDCEVYKSEKIRYFVNIKITNAKGRSNKNDIAAVEKLFMQYKTNPEYRLIYVVFGFIFNNTKISFVKERIHAFSPQFLPVYVNPRNDKIQAYYRAEPEERSREEFLELLKNRSHSIVLQ